MSDAGTTTRSDYLAARVMAAMACGRSIGDAYNVAAERCGVDRLAVVNAYLSIVNRRFRYVPRQGNETEPEREPDNRTDNPDNRLDGEREET